MKRDILYVDDEEDNIIVFEATFGTDFNVWTATSAQQAFTLLEARNFPVVICDQRMPLMNGSEMLQIVRRKYPRTKQIMLSAYNECTEVTEAINKGQLHWFAKPWCRNTLYPVLVSAIEAYDLAASHDEIKDYASALKEAEAAMEAATAAANAANRSKSEFLANMSHEIRTPLTAIIGFADILSGNVSDQERREASQTIRRNGEYLLQLVNAILDLSKIEAGKLEVEHVAASPLEIIDEVAQLMQIRAAAKGLSLTVEYQGLLPETIATDRIRFRQILINLVGNAIKFTDQGSVRVAVRLLESAGSQPQLRIDVVDTGLGMTRKHIGRLFQPFCQVDDSTARRHAGTGLGLTISKRLAELLGGCLSVESSLGSGSTFTFTTATGPLDGIRRVDRTTRPAAVSNPAPQVVQNEHNEKLDARVLVAEDGPDNQRLISYLLRRAGLEVVLADNGQTAVDLALEAREAGRQFEVILMDMQMPLVDGYIAASRLREAAYDGPIIALTAHAMSGDREKCLSFGCNEYLTKPIDRQQLLSVVSQFCRSKVQQH